MSNSQARADFPQQNQRLAVCFSRWRKSNQLNEAVEQRKEDNSLTRFDLMLELLFPLDPD